MIHNNKNTFKNTADLGDVQISERANHFEITKKL